jgi:hypothetical protein
MGLWTKERLRQFIKENNLVVTRCTERIKGSICGNVAGANRSFADFIII